MMKSGRIPFDALSDEQKRTVRRSAAMLFACVIGFVISGVGAIIYVFWAGPGFNWLLFAAWGMATCFIVQAGLTRIAKMMEGMIAESQPSETEFGQPQDLS